MLNSALATQKPLEFCRILIQVLLVLLNVAQPHQAALFTTLRVRLNVGCVAQAHKIRLKLLLSHRVTMMQQIQLPPQRE